MTSVDKAPPPAKPVPAITCRVVGTFAARSVVRLATWDCAMPSAGMGSLPETPWLLPCVVGVRAFDKRLSVASTTLFAVADPLAAKSAAMVPLEVILPPVKPVPAVTLVTAPAAMFTPELTTEMDTCSGIRRTPRRC